MSTHRRSITPALLSVAVAFALYGPSGARAQVAPIAETAPLAAAVPAQTEEPNREDAETLDQVVVTYRASLERALDKKRESIGQIDAIISEDIGKFPDLNLAESLQRIPGVSIARDAGEGRNISVRGLGPAFTRVRINGMEALTTAGGSDSSGGANRGRGFDFNVFASDLFNSLTVRKTSSADIEEGSLGATVDLEVARPFDYDGFTLVTSAQAGYNDLSEDTDPRGAFLVSNTFADGRVGVLFSAAYTKRNLIEEGHSTVRWDNGTSSGGFSPDSPFTDALLPGTFHPRIPRYGVLGHEQERLGLTTSIQFEPTDTTRISLDVLYADFDATRSEDFLEAISFSRTGAAGKPGTIVRDGAVDSNGNLVYGVFDNVDVRSESRYDELATTFTQFSFKAEQELSDTLRANALFGASESELDNPIQTTITLDHPDADGVTWDYRGDSRLPLINYGFDVGDPANWQFANGLSEIRLRPQTATNKFETAGFDLQWDFNDDLRFKGGVLWKSYNYESTERRRASETAVPGLPAGMTLADLTNFISLYGTNVPAGTDTGWVIPDIEAFNRLLNIYSNQGTYALSDAVASVRANNNSVGEDSLGFFVQADFEAELGGIPLLGNVGVRQVQTDQTSTGYALVGSTPVLTTVERDYDDTLPAFNLTAEVTEDFLVRFGVAKVMSRAGLANLTPGVTVSVSGGNRTVNGGNPALEPFRAKTADLAFEWYYADEALLGLALFYKDIESFVQTSRETRPYNSSGLPVSLLDGTGALPTDDFQFNIPLNTPGGELRGFEASWQTPFTFLPIDGFGAILNYTWVDSKIQYLTAAGAASLNTDLVGLSKNAYNATLYYENERFGARVSAAYRDDYLTTVPGRNNNDVEGTKNTLNVDFSASYRINDQFELTFEGLNLTDEYNDQWVSSTGDRVSVYHHTGRQYMAGFRFKY